MEVGTTEQAQQVVTWLADAPLFIDSDYIAAMYDAVIRPEAETGTTTISMHKLQQKEFSGEVEGEAKFSLPHLLKAIIPGIDFEATVEGSVGAKLESEHGREETIELKPIDNPHRQLIHLTVHYLVNLPKRIVLDTPEARKWTEPDFTEIPPRALVFMDLPSGTKFVPTAAELFNGYVITLFDKLATALTGVAEAPYYPGSKPGVDEQTLRGPRKDYWNWYDQYFRPEVANQVIEKEVAGGGLISWIDYRMPLDQEGTTLHLSLAGRKRYDTGTFAYNFVQRGFRHGLRIVGALRSGPSLRVLAVYEK